MNIIISRIAMNVSPSVEEDAVHIPCENFESQFRQGSKILDDCTRAIENHLKSTGIRVSDVRYEFQIIQEKNSAPMTYMVAYAQLPESTQQEMFEGKVAQLQQITNEIIRATSDALEQCEDYASLGIIPKCGTEVGRQSESGYVYTPLPEVEMFVSNLNNSFKRTKTLPSVNMVVPGCAPNTLNLSGAARIEASKPQVALEWEGYINAVIDDKQVSEIKKYKKEGKGKIQFTISKEFRDRLCDHQRSNDLIRVQLGLNQNNSQGGHKRNDTYNLLGLDLVQKGLFPDNE